MHRKIIKLTEQDLHNIISKSVKRYMLSENRESKNMKMARNIVRQYQPNADAMQVITAIREQIPNSRLLDCKFLPGVTQMFMKRQILDDGTKLNDTIGKIAQGHADEYDSMLNNEDPDTLINRFSGELQADFDKDVEEHNNTQFTENASYKIVRINAAHDAWYYNKFTDWCITSPEPSDNYEPEDGEYDDDEDWQDEFDPEEHDGETSGDDMYNTYTHNKLGVFYFCLKEGFEKVPKQKGENCPLDEYGLSMIATSVDDKGKCQTITCRWNHANNGNDHIMTPMQLSQIIGRNYYQTFLPRTKEELHEMGLMPFDEAINEIANGADPKDIFADIEDSGAEGVWIITLNEQQNYYNVQNNSYFKLPWFEKANKFNSGWALIDDWQSGIHNYMRPDGTFMFEGNFKGTLNEFNHGHALITKRDEGYNASTYIIDTNGKVINQDNPIEGYARNSEILDNGLILIKGYNGVSIYNINGDPVSNGEIKDLSKFNEFGFARCELKDGEQAIMTKNGEYVLGKPFPRASFFESGFMALCDNNGHGYICNQHGEPIMGRAFDGVWGIDKHGITSRIKLGNKYNYINVYKECYVSKDWLDDCSDWINGLGIVTIQGKSNLMDENGNYKLNNWYDNIKAVNWYSFPFIVEQDGKANIVYDENETMLDTWFDKINNSYRYNYLEGIIGGEYYLINKEKPEYKPYSAEARNADKARDEEERRIERWERYRDDY